MCQLLPFSLPRSLVERHLAYSEVRLLLASAPLAEGNAPYLYHRLAGAGAVRPASHLAHPQLLRRLGLQYVFHYYSPCPRGGKRRCRQVHHSKRCRRQTSTHYAISFPAHRWVSSTLGPRPAPHHLCGYRSAASLLDLGDVLHLHARPTLSHLVGYSVTVLESPVLAVCYVRGAHKQVYSANIRGDKPVACLGVVEPLEDSLGHMAKPTFPSLGSSATKATCVRREAFSVSVRSQIRLCLYYIIYYKTGAPARRWDPGPYYLCGCYRTVAG